MKQAQNLAQAVVRRPSLAGWSCMGPRRRNVVSNNTGVEETSASVITSEKVKFDLSEDVADVCSTSAAGESLTSDGGEGQQSAGTHYYSMAAFSILCCAYFVSS